jgi:asparaginyl-tRNA synthetase
MDWGQVETITLESSIRVTGVPKKHPKLAEYELHVSDLEVYNIAQEYPIGKKEHGVDFLMDQRHLWIRSPRQAAILRIRSAILKSFQDFYSSEGFYLTHTPSITANACEGSTDLFCIDYFGTPAFLSQNGQLYLEALAMALGKVYDLNPNFRAEKSSTRRHLIEFWTLNPEIAFCDLSQSIDYQEKTFVYLCKEILKVAKEDLQILERDTAALQKASEGNYPRLTHVEAVQMLRSLGSDIGERDDLGADDETILTKQFDRPIFITRYPAEVKSFYMEPDPADSSRVLNNDMLAPEGYGEIIGGSQRIADYNLLLEKIQQNNLKVKDYEWYLDLRKYGSVPHSGYGIGIERTVAWVCGLSHVREAIPFARTLNRVIP